jgi:hypothetical protein
MDSIHIGGGEFGVAYKAIHISDSLDVYIKIIRNYFVEKD